jgi:hypothetical protein
MVPDGFQRTWRHLCAIRLRATMKGRKVWFFSLLLVASAAALIYFLSAAISHRRMLKKYDSGFSQIKIGDSKDAVMSLMGEPSSIGRCEYAPFTDKGAEEQNRARCLEQYSYGVLLKDYVIYFDGNGKVLGKNSAVSP